MKVIYQYSCTKGKDLKTSHNNSSVQNPNWKPVLLSQSFEKISTTLLLIKHKKLQGSNYKFVSK